MSYAPRFIRNYTLHFLTRTFILIAGCASAICFPVYWPRWNCKDHASLITFFGPGLCCLECCHGQARGVSNTYTHTHTLAKSLRSGVCRRAVRPCVDRSFLICFPGIGGSLQGHGSWASVMFVLHPNHTPRSRFDSPLCISGMHIHSPRCSMDSSIYKTSRRRVLYASLTVKVRE
jgi:hypothetical protein